MKISSLKHLIFCYADIATQEQAKSVSASFDSPPPEVAQPSPAC